MSVTFWDMNEDREQLPIWARLEMIREGFPFQEVSMFQYLTPEVINLAFVENSKYGSMLVTR